jgi:YHS domain-containing protein
MSGRAGKKAGKNGVTKKIKTKVYKVFITTFTVVVMGGAMLWIGYGIYKDARETVGEVSEYQKSLPNLGDSIAHQKVCMASNIYLGGRQMEVPSDEKMYFACSEHCLQQLGIDSVHFAIDPVSHRKVDKALSIVTLHPDKSGKIIYFESDQTYNKYRQVLAESDKEK